MTLPIKCIEEIRPVHRTHFEREETRNGKDTGEGWSNRIRLIAVGQGGVAWSNKSIPTRTVNRGSTVLAAERKNIITVLRLPAVEEAGWIGGKSGRRQLVP